MVVLTVSDSILGLFFFIEHMGLFRVTVASVNLWSSLATLGSDARGVRAAHPGLVQSISVQFTTTSFLGLGNNPPGLPVSTLSHL